MGRQHIVSLSPATTEMLIDLGVEDRLVGVTENCCPGRLLPTLGPWGSPDYPRLQELNPDLILISGKFMDDVPAHLRNGGYRVEHFDPCSLDELVSMISRIGSMIGREDEAARTVRASSERLKRIDRAVARVRHRPTVYCEKCYHPSTETIERNGSAIVMVAGGLVPDIVERAGGEYGMVPRGGDFSWIPEGEVVRYNPEVILLNTCGGCDRLWPSDLAKREGWRKMGAMKEKKVFHVPVGLGTPTLRVLDGLELVLSILHPHQVYSFHSGTFPPVRRKDR